jgi:hypothetical protein
LGIFVSLLDRSPDKENRENDLRIFFPVIF